MNSEDRLITWNGDEQSKAEAMNRYADSLDAYEGVSKSQAGSYRDFKDIESNTSVRTGYGPNDYYSFRSEEEIPQKQKRIIKMCMEAYDKVGIVRNVIDLMGDFGQQGINLVHQNKSVEEFYQLVV